MWPRTDATDVVRVIDHRTAESGGRAEFIFTCTVEDVRCEKTDVLRHVLSDITFHCCLNLPNEREVI